MGRIRTIGASHQRARLKKPEKEGKVLAALGFGIIGTIILVIVVIAVIGWFMRRA